MARLLQKHDAFAKNYAARAYRTALESKNPANLAGLLAVGIAPNQLDDDNGRTALDRRQQTPLDYAVALKSIAAIRMLDTEGKHAALIAEFTKEFPPAPKSPFLGTWTNNRDGFSTVSILLNPDGSGRFGGGVMGGLLAWREVSPSEATAFIIGEKGQPIRDQPLTLRFDAEGRILSLEPTKGEIQRMIRAPK